MKEFLILILTMLSFVSYSQEDKNLKILESKDSLFRAIEIGDIDYIIENVNKENIIESKGGEYDLYSTLQYAAWLHQDEILDYLIFQSIVQEKKYLIKEKILFTSTIYALNSFAVKKLIDYQEKEYLRLKVGYILGKALSAHYTAKYFEGNDSKFFNATPQGAALQITHFLLNDERIDIDAQDLNGETGLFYCLEYPELVTLFLSYGANPNILDKEGMTILDHAIENLINPLMFHFGSDKYSLSEPFRELEVINILIDHGAKLSNKEKAWSFIMQQLIFKEEIKTLSILDNYIEKKSIKIDYYELKKLEKIMNSIENNDLVSVVQGIVKKLHRNNLD